MLSILSYSYWYADFVNYLAVGVLLPDMNYQRMKKFLAELKNYYWDEPPIFKRDTDDIFQRHVPEGEMENVIT